MKSIVIDGNAFDNMQSFYTEVQNKLTSGLTWEIGRNLNAFNDILWGGFGVHEYEEQVCIEWFDSEKSRVDLGYEETVRSYKEVLKNCHPSSVSSVANRLEEALSKQGDTIFDTIIAIIESHREIKLILK